MFAFISRFFPFDSIPWTMGTLIVDLLGYIILKTKIAANSSR
jgi:hypothetical protein